jgi:GNAT superfamily N-acetyltransferase
MMPASAVPLRVARPLGADDVERVIAIDRAHTGKARRRFFEKRFAAARAHPDEFIHVGIDRGGLLAAFAMAHVLRGEFGRDRAIAVLDVIGIEPEVHERGIGQALMRELNESLRRIGIGVLQSQVAWTSHRLLRFFAASGFELAPRLALERAVAPPLEESSEQV